MRMIVVAALTGAALLPAQALAASPFDGTWKEDIASAKISQEPDVFLLKDGMFTCKTCVPSYTVKADGTDQPVSGNPYVDTIAVNATDMHNVVLTEKKSGKTTETLTFKIAPDGKTVDVDFSGTSTNGAPYSGSGGLKRVAHGPAGSEPISGSWLRTGLTNASSSIVTVTYKVDGDMLSMTDPTGDSYTAKMDGTEAPYKGNPGITTVSVKKTGPRSMLETDMRDGKTIETLRSTVAKDGNSMTVVDSDKLHHRVTTYKADKQ
ncbi:MAG TPA: hypothetical protein VMF67_07940 [Rhizomicrobium sp.]|nr:hypothetical protein [Rhizomicrobium sp.]